MPCRLSLLLAGKQVQSVAMAQFDRTEVPLVDACDLGNAEALGYGHHVGIHDPEREALVLLD